ncbi:hypothetical protein [Burkholderia sp. TSV86]|uniref:hypothetical protein n=1 Tax=Burkholderia sp. TSV86 TaxID=1385594 RepID=UPI000AAD1A3C|nr:hypothetical protein [Burkholderia sp. TSV86]
MAKFPDCSRNAILAHSLDVSKQPRPAAGSEFSRMISRLRRLHFLNRQIGCAADLGSRCPGDISGRLNTVVRQGLFALLQPRIGLASDFPFVMSSKQGQISDSAKVSAG